MVVYSLGSLTLWVSRVEGLQRSLARFHGFKGLFKSKVLANFKILGRQGFPLRGLCFQGYNMSKSSKVSKALGRQVSKVKGVQG